MMLSTLQRKASASARWRGHSLRWSAPWHGEYRSVQLGTCRHCGHEVWISTRPLPNEIAQERIHGAVTFWYGGKDQQA